MPEYHTPTLRSPLGDELRALTPASDIPRAGVRVAEWANVGCLVVRGDGADPAFGAAVREVTGLSLPHEPSTLTSGPAGAVALWMSPDEWWLLMPRHARDEMLAGLRERTAGLHAQVVDNSGSIALLRVAGPDHVRLLRHLTPYDTALLTPGRCVSTVVPKASMTIVRSDDDGVMLLFRRSFASWIWQILQRSARPYGLAICSPQQLTTPVFEPLLAERSRPTLIGALL